MSQLVPEERRILVQALAAGGCCKITGLELRDMVRAASVVLDLQRRGCVKASIRFTRDGLDQPERIDVQLTKQGRTELEAAE